MKWITGHRWGLGYNRFFMVQYALDFTFSLGLHLDPVRRAEYGPYLDLHLIAGAISLGRNPGGANNHSLMRPELMNGHHRSEGG